jgi:hypothetical protein
MKVKTGVKGGRLAGNRCETSARTLKIRTGVKGGRIALNRCETCPRS